ncbi:MAG: 16S rRNA (cytidine(1402)-2'-O)-methyltransferase [Burkholderiaceae bacterium]
MSEITEIGQAQRTGPDGFGALYVVATPIGNLSDLSERTIAVLREVAWVAAEDTRTTRLLLDRAGSTARMLAAHQHNERAAAERIVALLGQGHPVALVSDAGTPAVSDPGCRIVSAVLDAGLQVVPIPGPSAAIAMVSASGLVDGPFHFEGFLPTRPKARDARLATLARLEHPFVVFEAPHRIAATLPAIAAHCGSQRRIALGRELTKRFEEVFRCPAGNAADWLAADPNRLRGEYVLVVDGAPATDAAEQTGIDVRALLTALLEVMPTSQAVKIAMRATGRAHRELYRLALECGQGTAD